MVTYNRQEVGKRLGCRRREMGLTGEEMGRRIGKNGRYYRDIENGRCGMSVETLILLSEEMGLSLDYLIYGASPDDSGDRLDEQKQIVNRLSHCNGRIREGGGESVEGLFGICSKVIRIKVIPIIYNPIDAMNR
ncbi:MAG: helix-turn-helix domain-containing protein [Hungatella sp.]|uniref:helix-turn-helix domain-containing protein n=1 Tax=Hungatella sp. TaxID=2613924 RepID=UPI00399277A9